NARAAAQLFLVLLLADKRTRKDKKEKGCNLPSSDKQKRKPREGLQQRAMHGGKPDGAAVKFKQGKNAAAPARPKSLNFIHHAEGYVKCTNMGQYTAFSY